MLQNGLFVFIPDEEHPQRIFLFIIFCMFLLRQSLHYFSQVLVAKRRIRWQTDDQGLD